MLDVRAGIWGYPIPESRAFSDWKKQKLTKQDLIKYSATLSQLIKRQRTRNWPDTPRIVLAFKRYNIRDVETNSIQARLSKYPCLTASG
jgi:hypothetical protein